jgi:Plasmid pRiA4b ORF-3-like protein
VTLRVRVDLADTKPPVWRRLELASDLFLDDVHEIMQAAFGWTDSHLHRFGCGPAYYSRETEYYRCPYSVDEGDEGVPEDQVGSVVSRPHTKSPARQGISSTRCGRRMDSTSCVCPASRTSRAEVFRHKHRIGRGH